MTFPFSASFGAKYLIRRYIFTIFTPYYKWNDYAGYYKRTLWLVQNRRIVYEIPRRGMGETGERR